MAEHLVPVDQNLAASNAVVAVADLETFEDDIDDSAVAAVAAVDNDNWSECDQSLEQAADAAAVESRDAWPD